MRERAPFMTGVNFQVKFLSLIIPLCWPGTFSAAADFPVFPGGSPTNGQTIQLDISADRKLEFVWVEKLQAWVGRCPVTHAQFHLFQSRHLGPEDRADASIKDQMPVSNISYADACGYAAWVNARVSQYLPTNAIVSLPRDDDLCFLRGEYPGENDQVHAWLKCHGLNCPAIPNGPLLRIRNIPPVSLSDQAASELETRHKAVQFDIKPEMWEWTINGKRGRQITGSPSLMEILMENTSIKYSDSTQFYPSLLGFRLVIRQ